MRFPLVAAVAAALTTPDSLAASSRAAGAAEERAVVVDYCVRDDAYRVVGDVSLLSQRFSPGSTFKLIIAVVALDSGELTGTTEIPCRANGGDSARVAPLTLPQALRESNDDFFAQVLKRTGYDPVRKFLVASRYTPAVPEAVGSFADLVHGEPLRVTAFEQNLFLRALLRRELPLSAEIARDLERWLAVDAAWSSWGKAGIGELSSETPRYVSWFNGVARLRDGPHVMTVIVLTSRSEPVALERFRRYLSTHRRLS